MQCFYIVWNMVQLGIVLIISKNVKKDSFGMGLELLFVQVT